MYKVPVFEQGGISQDERVIRGFADLNNFGTFYGTSVDNDLHFVGVKTLDDVRNAAGIVQGIIDLDDDFSDDVWFSTNSASSFVGKRAMQEFCNFFPGYSIPTKDLDGIATDYKATHGIQICVMPLDQLIQFSRDGVFRELGTDYMLYVPRRSWP
jgi:hypothetical protein